MPIRATVWGENVHEQKNKFVAENYPKGMHGQIAALLSDDPNIVASTVTLQDPEHGMTEAKLAAARQLGIPVVVVRRPPLPPGVTVVETVDDGLAWLRGS